MQNNVPIHTVVRLAGNLGLNCIYIQHCIYIMLILLQINRQIVAFCEYYIDMKMTYKYSFMYIMDKLTLLPLEINLPSSRSLSECANGGHLVMLRTCEQNFSLFFEDILNV